MQDTADLLPGFNCGRCGRRRCRDFAVALTEGASLDECPYLSLEKFASVRESLEKGIERVEVITGVVDGLHKGWHSNTRNDKDDSHRDDQFDQRVASFALQ